MRVEDVNGPVIIEPHPCGFDRATGVVPTRYGPVKVTWRIHEGLFHVDMGLPASTGVDFREPAGFEVKTDFRRSTHSGRFQVPPKAV